MSDSILHASVQLSVDTASVDKSIKQASDKLKTSLDKSANTLSKGMSKQLGADIQRLGGQLKQAGEKLSRILEKGMKTGLGLGLSAFYSFLKSGTPEAVRFADSIDKIKVAWARVGQALATKIKIGGNTGQQWIDIFVEKLENINTNQIEKALGYFKDMAFAWGSIKALTFGGSMVGMAKNIKDIIKEFKNLTNSNQNSLLSNNFLPSLSGVTGANILTKGTGKPRLDPKFVRDELDAYKEAQKDPGKLAMWRARRDLVKGAREEARRNWNISRGIGGAEAIGYGTYKGISTEGTGGQRTATGIAFAGVGLLGAALGGPIGATITLALAEGAQLLGTAIGNAFYKVGEDQRGTFKTRIGEEEAYRSKLRLLGTKGGVSAYLSQQVELNNRNNIESGFYKSTDIFNPIANRLSGRFNKIQNSYASGAPSSATKDLIFPMETTRDTLETLLEQLKKSFGDTEILSPLRDQLKTRIDEVSKSINDLDSNINSIISTYSNEQEKINSVQKSLEAFDKNASDAMMNYDIYAQNLLQENPKALVGSISMGGDISSLPAIISQSLQDSKNSEAQKQVELMQKGIDLEEAYGKMMEDMWANDQARTKFLEEEREQFKRSQKTREQLLEEAKSANEYGAEMTRLLGSGSSTVTIMS